MAEQKRAFRMHTKLLHDVILRQAGSLEKGILEGVMNSVDAGSSICDIKIEPTRITISDDGKGIQSIQEVETWFEVFGQPHEENEGKIFGTFRMGRGQMFAYGLNKWKTGPFEMEIDIRDKGLDYSLKQVKKSHPGCSIEIELYTSIGHAGASDAVRQLSRWCRYVDPAIDIRINGETVNVGLAQEKWDHVTEEAYIRLSQSNDLPLYNLGIHTMDLSTWTYGTGGVVVTRKNVKVNFARNEIMSTCPVWQKIKPFLVEKSQEKIAKTKRLTETQRKTILRELGRDGSYKGIEKMSVFTTLHGRTVNNARLRNLVANCGNVITFAPEGNLVADRMWQQELVYPFSEDNLSDTGWTDREFTEFLIDKRIVGSATRYTPLKELKKDLKETFTLLAADKLTPLETAWVDTIAQAAYSAQRGNGEGLRNGRGKFQLWDYRVGISDCADGWTDGQKYVAFDRKFLEKLEMDLKGFIQLGHVLVHEWCHHEASSGSHGHDEQFYKEFHDRLRKDLPVFVTTCLQHFPKALERIGRKMTRKQLLALDKRESDFAKTTKITNLIVKNESESAPVEPVEPIVSKGKKLGSALGAFGE